MRGKFLGGEIFRRNLTPREFARILIRSFTVKRRAMREGQSLSYTEYFLFFLSWKIYYQP